jgi:hypothetical protein
MSEDFNQPGYHSGTPYGAETPRPTEPQNRKPAKRVGLVVGGIAALMLGYGVGASTNADSSDSSSAGATVTKTAQAVTKTAGAVTKTVSAPPAVGTRTVTLAPKRSFDDGAWLVGRDIKPGTYTTVKEVGGTCYWERRNPNKDGIAAIIANNNVAGGFPTVILKTGEEFKSMDCGSWRAA